METERSLFWTAVAPSLLLLVVVGMAVAGSVTIPNAFVPGSVADANQVNANFAAVASEINDNDARITAIENGTTATPLDADLLGGLAGNQLVRAAYIQSTTSVTTLTSSWLTVATRTVQAPVDGILLIWGEVQAEKDQTDTGQSDLWVRLTIDSAQVGVQMEEQMEDAATGFDESTVHVFAAAPVTAGSRSVDMDVYETGSLDLWVRDRSLMTLFIPFGNAGTQGALKPAPAADGVPEAEVEEIEAN